MMLILRSIHINYFSGLNNDVVLNKRVGWIFSLPGKNACLWKIFKSYYVKKLHGGRIFL